MTVDPDTLHKSAFVADLHCDTVLHMSRGHDINARNERWHIDLPRLREGGVNLQVFACFVGFVTPEADCPAETHELLDTLEREFERLADQITVCRTAAEARAIVDSDRIAAFIGIENGMALNNDLGNLERFYERGVRYLTLIHNKSNTWCISANDSEPAFDGLTEFGCDVVRRMNELGIIVDVSHVHPLGVTRALKVTTKPIIASHSCVHALNSHVRNLTDEQIRAIADNGGMIGINYHGDFISQRRWKATRRLMGELSVDHERLSMYIFGEDLGDVSADEERQLSDSVRRIDETVAPVNATLKDVVDHIEYIAKLVGPEFVGLGSDFDGIYLPPVGLEDTAKVPRITAELLRRGFDERAIRLILGENFLRVFAEVCG